MFLVFMDYPKSVIRLLRANEAIFLSSVSLLLDYKGPPLHLFLSRFSILPYCNVFSDTSIIVEVVYLSAFW